jgi:phosphinothricin acetyltransferase
VKSATIRTGDAGDLTALLAIYNHYVEHSSATFDVRRATMAERGVWLSRYAAQTRYQLLVAHAEGDVLGYATSSRYRPHPAFAHTVETSVYVHPDATGQGVGGRLYDALLERLHDTDVHLAVAAVALPNDASVALHRSRRFREVGTFTEYAVKRNRWISSTWFERRIARD